MTAIPLTDTDGDLFVESPAAAADVWVDVCALEDLQLERGACALIGSQQVALFRLAGDAVFALSNRDPFSRINVLSRGIVGTAGDVDKVASPMYKQTFDLRTGRCLDDPSVSVPAFPTRVVQGRVEVAVAASA